MDSSQLGKPSQERPPVLVVVCVLRVVLVLVRKSAKGCEPVVHSPEVTVISLTVLKLEMMRPVWVWVPG
jgi:hypothetical protein